MSTITRLQAGKKNPGRINLYLDGEFAFALTLDEVVKNGLKKGLNLTQDQVEALKKNDDLNWVYAKILNFISFRPRTTVEVKKRAKTYGINDPVVLDKLVHKLKSQGYLDDLAFARWFVDSRRTHRPRSARHLSAELLAKGVDKEVARVALASLDEKDSLQALIAKKSQLSRESLIAFLLRRGFGYSLIKQQLDEMGK